MNLLPADGEISAHIKVEKADGSVLYYRVQNGQHIELTEVQYLDEIGVGI